ncbi:MAG TPA: crossover junction endodeoxyribonuclease RuvC, partial [Ignavibacteria bacterium]|nr:crossover junction endodeoxyribonuclease RuvC [Ignavibacteria bacterium]
MRILGVDPGSLITGYGIIEDKSNHPGMIGYGVVKLSYKDPLTVRLKKIYDDLMIIIGNYKPDCLSIETAFYGKNIQSTLKLGQARGVAILAALNSGMEVTEYSPREVKKSVTGNGASSKNNVLNYVKSILVMNENPAYIDSSDALAVALCHFFSQGNSLPVNRGKRKNKNGWADYIMHHQNK